MSGLFDDEDTLPTAASDATVASEPKPPVAEPVDIFGEDESVRSPAVMAPAELPLFSDEAHQRVAAAKSKAKAVAKEGATQAVNVARATATKAIAEWIPAAKAKWASECAKGISKSTKQFGAAMALVTVCASAGIWWQAQPRLAAPTRTPTATATASVSAQATSVAAPTASIAVAAPIAAMPVTPVPAVAAPVPTPASPAPVVHAPAKPPASAAPTDARPQEEDVGQPGHMKPVSFNPMSPAYNRRTAAPVPAKPKIVEKTAWEKEQDAKLDQWGKRGQ